MVDSKCIVNFACQRCLQPIKLDETFNVLGEHTLAELSLPINVNPEVDLESQAASLDHYVPPFRLHDSGNGANGFMLISDAGETETLGHFLKVRAELFDTLSENSNIDHPLCDECTDSLLELMDQELKITETECNEYNEYLKKLESAQDDPNIEALEKELADLKNEESRLLSEMEALKLEEMQQLQEIAEKEKEKERLEQEENHYWREYTKHRHELMTTEDEYKSIDCQLAYAQSRLDKLKKTNVFNATFHIWHSGHFGTINKFRLGRLPSEPVDWSEINAAWGQTALLLTSLARKMNLTFQRYKIVPYGNHSYVEVLADHKELPLYGSGGFRFLWDTKFDAAMVAFLDCLQQFKEEVEKGDSAFCLPYRMDRGKIEDSATGNTYSIRIQLNSEEQWTKALKFMLTNLKWGLAWVSSQLTEETEDV
ncbi:beclin-1-like protein [Ctenocephalides felis]|uniref:beclin-1-like protein n=1 Tax=Ctenocephalides felis TaxID=7515 RepID=UPI000E6E5546|nr:beclin-1-like protein [Ctenocephalides felis]